MVLSPSSRMGFAMSYPFERPRRLRRTERLRAMVRETTLSPANLIYPLFVAPGEGLRREIPSLPGCFHLSVDEAGREAEEVERLGIAGVILLGLPSAKDPVGSEGYADDGVVQEAVRAIRSACRELLVVTDVCLCEYTSHGHCGVVENGEVQTIRPWRSSPGGRLACKGGADIVAPSDMMDGRVGAIREGLDEAGYEAPPSSPMPQSTPRPSTAPSGRRRNPPLSSGIAAATRWTPPTRARRCARWRSTWRRGRTS